MKIFISVLIFVVIYSTLSAQNNDIHTIYTTIDGTQSSMLFKNTGSLFSLNDNDTYRIQKDENGTLNSKLTVSGDFDADGVQESALFYDYTYIPNGQPKFIASKIIIYKQKNQSIIPVGTWFSKLKSDFNFDEFSIATAGDYNGDGKTDIALFRNTQTSETQNIIILQSNGSGFDEPKVFFNTSRELFNFNALKHIVSGDFSGDNKCDIAVFYDYFGESADTNQNIYIFESGVNSFSLSSPVFSTTKAIFDFDVCKAALSGDYNGDGKDDIACLINDEINDKQAIEVFENKNKNGFNKTTYLSPDRNDFNFSHVKLSTSGQITADNKTDILLCYDHTGFGSQIMFVYESTGNSFAAYKSYFGAPKLAFSFDNVNALFVGKYDGKPKVTPTIWYNNKKGAVTFGFDDGMTNALRYGANELSKNKLKGTFYIISNIPFNNEADYCNWDTLRYYKNLGHEMGSHTANHKFSGNYSSTDSIIILNNLLLKSKNDLDAQLNQNTLSLSYPFGSFNQQTPTELAKYFSTARTSQEGYNLPTPFDFHALKSHYIASTTPNKTIKSFFQTVSNYNYHISLMYHNIQKEPFDKLSDEYSFALNDLSQNIRDAKNADLWIETQENVYKYTKERNAFQLISYETFDDSIRFNVDDFLDNTIFNQQISLQVEIPELWSQDSVFTNVSAQKSAIFTINGSKYCLVNAIPNNSQIIVSKTKILSANKFPQIKSENLIKCFRTDKRFITIDSFSDNNDIFNIKIFSLTGVVLFEKNILLSSNLQIELPFSQQLKYIVIRDNQNRLVNRKMLF